MLNVTLAVNVQLCSTDTALSDYAEHMLQQHILFTVISLKYVLVCCRCYMCI
jgi:hypothetical protein